jgi:hypothetical protein
MSTPICFDPNHPSLEDKPHWIATLSDNTQAYQDDDGAWTRLAEHLRANGLFIKSMHFRFRTHIVPLPKSEAGYYFSRGVGAWGGAKPDEYFVHGHVAGDMLIKNWYRIPELVRCLDAVPTEEVPVASVIGTIQYIGG